MEQISILSFLSEFLIISIKHYWIKIHLYRGLSLESDIKLNTVLLVNPIYLVYFLEGLLGVTSHTLSHSLGVVLTLVPYVRST